MLRFRLTLLKRIASYRDPRPVLEHYVRRQTREDDGASQEQQRERKRSRKTEMASSHFLRSGTVEGPTLDQLLNATDSICQLLDVTT